ncbi:DUF1488 domain-containing protein [Vibrio hannami]|uniref:DUF1488 domain-containing protein n=1 Tax=Vibrio hannami TaxID=2717094 RepID=UPI00240F78AB|nr:DUF1488 domain-containing protein [Vibrio hannami]MDG3086721.1 DUF1488 domain-containing protein [Vibrio hannami]
MNQSILFPDIQEWKEESQVVIFPAQQSGALIECLVSKPKLAELSGRDIVSGEDALSAFTDLRFDLEEIAEELIEDEMFNSSGQIEII